MERRRDSSENEERLSYYEENFKEVLSPLEPTIMRVQSLLVWETPVKSAVIIAGVHCVFWFFMYSGCRFYSTLSTIIMVILFLRIWKKKIWPEIRVPPKTPDIDEWTPVHPRLLSVPELSKHLASTWCYILNCVNWWSTLRRDRPLKFCIETSFIFTCLAVVGHYISDIMLSYVIIMSVILWPCLQYHNLLKKIYMKFEPVFMKLDYSIKVKNKWRYEGDRSVVTTKENRDDDGMLTTSVCADNESDLEDFYPSDPMISAALARAITDSEDEGGTSSMSLTPRLSKEPSVVNSDDDNNHTGDLEADLAPSIDMMPSFDEFLDNTDDELLLDLPGAEPPRASRERSDDSIRFIPTHFEESDEETTLAHDVPRPERHRTSKRDSRHKKVVGTGEQDIMTQALTSIVSSAIQSSVLGTLQNLAAKSNPSLARSGGDRVSNPNLARSGGDRVSNPDLARCVGDRVASTHSDSDDEDTMAMVDQGYEEAHRDRKLSEDTSSLNIEDEFEFLDEYDIGSSE